MYICLEIVVVGTGEKILRLDPEIHSYLKRHNILLEVQDTVSLFVQIHPLMEICKNLKKLRKRLPFGLCSHSISHFSQVPTCVQNKCDFAM